MTPLAGVRWVFLDVGSTLVDESAAYRLRVEIATAGTAHRAEAVYARMAALFRAGRRGEEEALAEFGLARPPWPSEAETLIPGAQECVAALHRVYRVGIIANQPPGTRARLAAWGLLPHIDVLAVSDEEGLAKPDPRLFERALARARCAPHEAVMVGDRLDNDILPARALGMRTLWVRQGLWGLAPIADAAGAADCTADTFVQAARLLLNAAQSP